MPRYFDESYSGKVFIMSRATEEEARAVIYGMPMDYTVSFRPGSRFGPNRIREASIGLEEYSPYLDRHLEEVAYHDAGDLMFPFGNAQKSLDIIEDYAKELFKKESFRSGSAESILSAGRSSGVS